MEKNGNGNTVLLTVIGVATLLVALVGATFAYFTATVTGDKQQVNVQAATPTGLTYTRAEDAALSLLQGIPGESDEKTFSIANNDANNAYKYSLELVVTQNGFTETTAENVGAGQTFPEGADGLNQLVFTFTGKEGTNPLTLTTSSYDATGKGTTSIPVDTARVIQPNKTHTYTAKVEFVNKEYSQNNNSSAKFVGHFTVKDTVTHNVG